MKINKPFEQKETIQMILKQNIMLFAKQDNDLRSTRTTEMNTDTGSHPPMKLRLCHKPFSRWQIVNKAIDDMLLAKIIHPSRSPCFMYIVVVDEKMAQRGFV